MDKRERHQVLLEIISTRQIKRQEQLVKLLRKKGFVVTQASVSRDLDEVGIAKERGVYRLPAARSTTPFGLVSFQQSGDCLVVAKCGSGLASAFAVRLDAIAMNGIVGTIAGDDTVFVAVADQKAQKTVIRRLREYFSE